MSAIWDEENKFRIWLEIETLACEKMAEMGTIPASVPKVLREKGNFEISRIDKIEQDVRHDVIAFLTNVAEYIGEDARFVHQGMTSSDVVDTALSVQMTQAADILLRDLNELLAALKKRAIEHKETICIGRSHGIHAEPTSFGLKLASHYAAFARARKRLENAREEIAVCQISGAVGTYATIDPAVEEYVAEKLGMMAETISTQIIPRDRHAAFFSALGLIASSVENLATEIRHMQRTELSEAQEYFSDKQKGSSAMPHKRNPILSENITGLARVIRASVIPAMENVTTWHERDISHSSVERIFGPDACLALDMALSRLTGIVDKLIIHPDRMMDNLNRLKGLVFSQRVLLALTQAGISREDAYRIVQRNAMQIWEDKDSPPFMELLKNDEEVSSAMSNEELEAIFDLGDYTKHVDHTFKRVFG
jgi:adenylosuccinate lyase